MASSSIYMTRPPQTKVAEYMVSPCSIAVDIKGGRDVRWDQETGAMPTRSAAVGRTGGKKNHTI